jgi:hypothetical protein
MQQQVSKGSLIAAIAAAVVLFAGLGWFLFFKPSAAVSRPAAESAPQMPPGGYAAGVRGGGGAGSSAGGGTGSPYGGGGGGGTGSPYGGGGAPAPYAGGRR